MVAAGCLAADALGSRWPFEFSATRWRRGGGQAAFIAPGHGKFARARAHTKAPRLERAGGAGPRGRVVEIESVTRPSAQSKPDQPASRPLPNIFSALFGALLGLCLLKFGNPVVMEKFI